MDLSLMAKSPSKKGDMQAILDELDEGILLVDPEGSLLLCNDAAKKMLEISGDRLPDDLQQTQHPFEVFHHGKELSLKTCALGKNLLMIVQDVSAIKKLQALAARHDRMQELGDMVATIAHEIRNPIGGIRGFASLLHRDLQEQPKLQEMAQHIIHGADSLNRLVTNVLNYARPTQLRLEPVELNQLVEELRQHVQADPSLQPSITLEYHPSPTELKALIDPQLIQSALLNLVVNAIQAMPEGGKLTLNISQKGDSALIKVADTGIGIAEENMPKLFTPFFTTRPDGNGFGLAEVKKIVQAHGGTIDVASKEGKGTTFTVHLPLKRPS
jgi:signal transduction histidine kinase